MSQYSSFQKAHLSFSAQANPMFAMTLPVVEGQTLLSAHSRAVQQSKMPLDTKAAFAATNSPLPEIQMPQKHEKNLFGTAKLLLHLPEHFFLTYLSTRCERYFVQRRHCVACCLLIVALRQTSRPPSCSIPSLPVGSKPSLPCDSIFPQLT